MGALVTVKQVDLRELEKIQRLHKLKNLNDTISVLIEVYYIQSREHLKLSPGVQYVQNCLKTSSTPLVPSVKGGRSET